MTPIKYVPTLILLAEDPPAPGFGDEGGALWEGLNWVGNALLRCGNLIKDNPVLMVFLAGGLITLGFRVFKRAKNSVR